MAVSGHIIISALRVQESSDANDRRLQDPDGMSPFDGSLNLWLHRATAKNCTLLLGAGVKSEWPPAMQYRGGQDFDRASQNNQWFLVVSVRSDATNCLFYPVSDRLLPPPTKADLFQVFG